MTKRMKKDLFDFQFEILLEEMKIQQQHVRHYFTFIFVIKGWAITVFSGLLYYAYREQEVAFLYFGFMATMLFWLLDALFKTSQRIYNISYLEIEDFLRNDFIKKAYPKRSFKGFAIPDLYARHRISAEDRWRVKSPIRGALYKRTSVLYFALILVNIVAYLWLKGLIIL